MEDAINAYSALVKKGCTNDTALSLNYSELQQTFLNGDGAMYPMGSFFAGAVPLDHPFEIGVFPMPALDGTPRLVTYTSGGPALPCARSLFLCLSKKACNSLQSPGMFLTVQ